MPTTDPNRRPADMVKGMAGMARIWDNINKEKLDRSIVHVQQKRGEELLEERRLVS